MKKTLPTKTVYTTTDIAKLVGVSQPVVSKVLNGGRSNVGVSPAIREKITRVARELGYRSNSAARAMRTGQFNCAALLLGTHQMMSLLPMPLFNGLVDALAKHRMRMTVAKLPDAKLVRDDVVPNLLDDLYADGLLINYNARIPLKFIEFVSRYRLPSVWINSMHEHDCVYPDDFGATVQLTRHFVDSGAKSIVYIGGDGWHYSSKLRFAGYQDAMQGAGLKAESIWLDLAKEADCRDKLRTVLDADSPPAAMVCYNEMIAEFICKVCEEWNVAVGTALRLGIVNDRLFKYRSKAMPTMVLPERELGVAAVSMLLRKIADPESLQNPVAVPCRLEGTEE